MAASAYAFLVSLNNTMDQIQLHPFTSTCFDKSQFESLREKVDLLVDFVENHSHDEEGDLLEDAAEDLLIQIAVVAQKAEDIIEVEAADRIRGRSTEISSISFLLDLQTKMEEMDRIINEHVMIKVKERESRSQDQDKHPHPPPTSSMAPPPPSSERAKTTSSSSSMVVGFEGYLNRLLDELSGYDSGRQLLPIVGMGGVGKTTLARNAYENQLTVESFHVRVWVTVSQTFNASDIFEQALSCIEKSSSVESDDDGDGELGEKLHKTLYGRRYLVVLDDMWSVKAWEGIKFYFPDNNNRSRIVVTTREQQLVDYFASSSVTVDLLGEENSWKLFCDKTFAEEGGCPPQLEAIGKKIVKKCKGLPLAISVLGGLLQKSPRTQEYWENVAQDKSLIPQDSGNEGNKLLSLLYMSYKHLPVCFKPCFLYLGWFPEDRKINVSELIKLWIAEGFIRPKANQTPEEVAESYVKELVDRNLLLVGGLRLNKKFKTCFLHDLVRELCIRIADKEKFHCVQRSMDGEQHYVVDQTSASSYTSSEPLSIYSPLVLEGQIAASFKSRLLRVLVNSLKCSSTSEEVNLRLLSDYGSNHRRSIFSRLRFMLTLHPKLPSSISLFWSLQSIHFHETMSTLLLSGIWKMPQLRHIMVWRLHLPDPPTDEDNAVVLRNLQTLKRVRNFNLSEEVCKRIPDIKELEIIDISQGEDWNVGCLSKLESLCCSWDLTVVLKNLNLTLPNSLRELSLKGCRLPWSYLSIIGLLPHLQILLLLKAAVVGEEWNLDVEERFLALKYLRIQTCDDLICWDADSSNFPVLETLSLEKLTKLEEIPSGIGDIPTLELMEIHYCSESAAVSAIKILEEQESLENLDLRLQLKFVKQSEAEMFKGKIQELGITGRNLGISYSASKFV